MHISNPQCWYERFTLAGDDDIEEVIGDLLDEQCFWLSLISCCSIFGGSPADETFCDITCELLQTDLYRVEAGCSFKETYAGCDEIEFREWHEGRVAFTINIKTGEVSNVVRDIDRILTRAQLRDEGDFRKEEKEA